jgi:hypothetical protein
VGGTTVEGSAAMRPVTGERHWPLPCSTVSPSGQRGVTISARESCHSGSFTVPPSGGGRPNSNCAVTTGAPPIQAQNGAAADAQGQDKTGHHVHAAGLRR